MDLINLGGTGAAGGTGNNAAGKMPEPALNKPENPSTITINFTPKIPPIESKKVEVVSLDVKKSELNKLDLNTDVKPESLNLGAVSPANLAVKPVVTPVISSVNTGLASLNISADVMPVTAPGINVSKPSLAWGKSLDVSKDVSKDAIKETAKPIVASTKIDLSATDKPKNDFFSSSALQLKSGSSGLMENITAQKLKIEQPKLDSLLGKQSKILEKTLEQETLLNYKKRLRIIQFMAFFVFLITVGVNSFLYFQLSPGINLNGLFTYNFDSNLRNDVFNLNQSLASLQINLSKYRYLSGQLYLNQFGYESTRFMDAAVKMAAADNVVSQAELAKIVTDSKEAMPKFLQGAKDNLTKPISVDTYLTRGEEKANDTEIQNQLRGSILTEKKAVVASHTEGGMKADDSEVSFYNNTVKLVGNNKLSTNLQSTNIDNFKSQADLYAATDFDVTQRGSFKKSIENLLASTKVNLATINKLRTSRVIWTDVLDRIEAITNKVNSDHNSGLGAGNSSLITYSGIELNSETGKITVNGINTTKSGTNREVVTYLLEAFEAAPEFKNVSNRSFPLNKAIQTDGTTTFTMNFKIDMEIENDSFSKLNAPLADLGNHNRLTAKALVRRLRK